MVPGEFEDVIAFGDKKLLERYPWTAPDRRGGKLLSPWPWASWYRPVRLRGPPAVALTSVAGALGEVEYSGPTTP